MAAATRRPRAAGISDDLFDFDSLGVGCVNRSENNGTCESEVACKVSKEVL